MRAVVRAAVHEFSADLEGRELPFMYLDSKGLDSHGNPDGTGDEGLVTIATGCLVDPVSMAVGLPFVHRDDGLPATRSEIVACWSLVKGRQDLRRHGGMIYERLAGNTLRLTPEATRNLVDKRITWVEVELAKLFPDWEDWPACAQLFGISWAWAVGAGAKYPKMIAALRARDFMTASEECVINPRRGTIEVRNQRNVMLLRNADRVQAYQLDPDIINWTELVGVADAVTLPELPQTISDAPPTPSPEGSYAAAMTKLADLAHEAVTNTASSPTVYPTPDTLEGVCVPPEPDDPA